MNTTLTIRNLAEPVKRKLRIQAASHGHSMEAEAREIIAAAVEGVDRDISRIAPPRTPEEMRQRIKALTGLWKERGSTDELMSMTRGED